jgi:hypothetical protein
VSPYEGRSLADFDATFTALKRDRAEALLVVADPLTFSVREQTMRFALENRLPGIYEFRAFRRLHPLKSREVAMMMGDGMMGGMMWGMGLAHLLVPAMLVLAVVALVKYVFFR